MQGSDEVGRPTSGTESAPEHVAYMVFDSAAFTRSPRPRGRAASAPCPPLHAMAEAAYLAALSCGPYYHDPFRSRGCQKESPTRLWEGIGPCRPLPYPAPPSALGWRAQRGDFALKPGGDLSDSHQFDQLRE